MRNHKLFIFSYLLVSLSIIEVAISMMDTEESSQESLVRKAPSPASRVVQTKIIRNTTQKINELHYDPSRDMLYRGVPLGMIEDNLFDLVENVYNRDRKYTFKECNNILEIPKTIKQQLKINLLETINNKNTENILKKVIPDRDGRIRVLNTLEWPYSINARITTHWGSRVYMGSGVLIGPHHLITTAHNVYDHYEKKWADNIEIFPALNNNELPFGKTSVAIAYAFKGWIKYASMDHDLALLILDESIGKHTGWASISTINDENALKNSIIHITGYPGDKGGKQMWTMADKIKSLAPETLSYEIDTTAGQSGSPVWVQTNEGVPIVIGIHTTGGQENNSGVLISYKKLNKIKEVLSKTYTLKSNNDE